MQDIKMETFLAVCEFQNFTKAADTLGLTQPAVSRQMKSLEEYYGVPLFRYEGKKLSLTPAGETLQRFAQVARNDEAFLQKKLHGQTAAPLRLGSTPTPGEFMLPPLIAAYLKEYPASNVHITIQNTEALLEKLDRGEIDLAAVEGNFSKQNYACLLFSRQNFVPILSSDQNVPGHTLEDLLSFPLILREPGSGNRGILEYSLRRHNLLPEDFAGIIEVNDIRLQKTLVRQGCGIAFLFEAAAAGEAGLKILSADGFPLQHEINLVWRKNSIFEQEYQSLAQYFCSSFQKPPLPFSCSP